MLLILAAILLIIAIAGGVIIHPLLFALADRRDRHLLLRSSGRGSLTARARRSAP